jgi:16S rRNA A1518/A1519 N6-dimethyltransferase RsmA/KsgA/DIM1 with predicted DNA glycosylase/AP lyase activity
VDSVAISFTRLEKPLLPLASFTHFESFVRKVFAGKRKQLQNVLKAHFEKDCLFRAFTETQIAPSIRAEALSLIQVHGLYSTLYKSHITG